jgi:hypothetical protein
LQQATKGIDRQRRRGNTWKRSRQYLGGANIGKRQQLTWSAVPTGINEPRPQPTVTPEMCHQRYVLLVESLNVTKAESRIERVHISAGVLAADVKTTYLTTGSLVGWHNSVRTEPDQATRLA